MLTEKQISALRASFPAEALSADNSRGFELTSIKAAFVVERLNEVFGPCGCGWRYVHSPFEWIEGEVLTEVALQFKVTVGGVNPVVWHAQAHGWIFVQDGEAWSWPIFSPGGRRPNKGNTPMTDARKGAITDGLTKAASMIGVGHEVFKGLVRPGQANAQPAKATQPAKRAEPAPGAVTAPTKPVQATPETVRPAIIQPAVSGHSVRNGNGNGATATALVQVIPAETGTGFPNGNGKVNGTSHSAASAASGHGVRNGDDNGASTTAVIRASATTFWMLANRHTDKLDRANVSALARQVQTGVMSWLEAQSILQHDMIEDTSMPTFGSINGPRETIHQKAVAGMTVQYAEKVRDPLDELFA